MYILFSVFTDLSLLICAAIALSYWYLTNNFDYWKKRNVAFDKPYPLLGTFYIQLFSGKTLSLALQSIYKRYPHEEMIGGFMSRQPLLILKNPDLIKQIFVKDFNHFMDRGFNTNPELDPLSQHLFLSSGETWKALRQKLTPTFTSGKMRQAFPIMLECRKEFQSYINDIVEKNEEPEIKDLMAKFTTDVIGSYAFGIKMNSIRDDNSPFRVMGRKLFEPSTKRQVQMAINVLVPRVAKLFGLRALDKYIQDFFIDLFKSVVHSRDNKPSDRHDFVDLLIQLKNDGYVKSDKLHQDEQHNNKVSTIKMSDELLAAQAFVFFIAGFETSSTTMTFALYELAKNTAIQQKVRDEIDRTLSKVNGQIGYEDLKEMKYLHMVVDETLRKYPPLGFLNRICTQQYTFPNTKISLDEGVLINIPVYALHHDPQYYPEPDKFIPERFSQDKVAKRHPFVYLPFGDGPRNCIGSRFGKYQSMVGLISILEKFSVETNNKTVTEMNFDSKAPVLSSDKGIHLTIKKRN